MYLGDFKAGKTVEFNYDTFLNGVPTTISAVTVKVYKNQATATEVTTGVTHSIDFDSNTGIHHVSVDLSSDAAYYAAGNEYSIIMTAATFGGASIRKVLAHFSIENRVVNWAQVASQATAVVLSSTTVKTATDVIALLPTALVSGRMDSSVGAMAANVLTATAIATDAITAAKIAADAIGASELAADAVTEIQSGLSVLTQANIRTAVGLGSANLDTQLGAIDDYIDTEVAAIKAKTDLIPAAPAAVGDIPTAAAVADAVWDETDSGHTVADSYGYKFGKHKETALIGLTTSGGNTVTVPINTTTGIDGGAPSGSDDFYNGAVIIFISGALKGQRSSVTDYDGATKILTVVALTAAPASGVSFVLV